MIQMFRKALVDNKGVAAMEYAILAGIIVLGAMATLGSAGLQTELSSKFNNLAGAVKNAGAANNTSN